MKAYLEKELEKKKAELNEMKEMIEKVDSGIELIKSMATSKLKG